MYELAHASTYGHTEMHQSTQTHYAWLEVPLCPTLKQLKGMPIPTYPIQPGIIERISQPADACFKMF
jgi:hypothetical protein